MEFIFLILQIIFWYLFTIISTIYSKLFLNETKNSHLLTLISFSYGTLLNILLNPKKIFNKIKLNKNKNIIILISLFNIGTTLLTNIGINQTSVSLTYMIKSSEPLFVILLSYYILEQKYNFKVIITILPISIGVSLTAFGEINFSNFGILCIFMANLASASRNIYYKKYFIEQLIKLNKNEEIKSFYLYLDVCLYSFILILPIYFLDYYNNNLIILNFNNFNYKILIYLLIATLSNFLYNLFSFKVLTNKTMSAITHSIINIVKRLVIVFSSIFYFLNVITKIQYIGMLIADLGVLSYSYFKYKSIVIKDVKINMIKKKIIQNITIFLLITTIISSCVINKDNDIINANLNNQYNICINKIQNKIINSFKRDIFNDETLLYKELHLFQIPEHCNYGDSFIW